MTEKPSCKCFTEGRGERMAVSVATELVMHMGECMNVVGLCPKSFDYTMMTALVMIMRGFAAQKNGAPDNTAERVEFQRMVVGLEDRLRDHEGELEKNAQAMILEMEQAAAGGVQ